MTFCLARELQQPLDAEDAARQRALAANSPATVAEADEPRPRDSGMWLSMVIAPREHIGVDAQLPERQPERLAAVACRTNRASRGLRRGR